MKSLLILVVMSMAGSAFAQTAEPTEYFLEGDAIESNCHFAPPWEVVDVKKHKQHPKLIQVPENFKDKVMKSFGEL